MVQSHRHVDSSTYLSKGEKKNTVEKIKVEIITSKTKVFSRLLKGYARWKSMDFQKKDWIEVGGRWAPEMSSWNLSR